MMMMSAMNPYSNMMNPYAAMFQQQQQRVPMMQPNMPFPMSNPFSQQNPQPLAQEPNMSGSIFSQPQPQIQQNNSIEFHPKVLTFNVFIDSSKTILQLAEAIYAKSSRLYPNLKRPIEILKIKDFEKNDLAVEDLISENFTGSLRKTVLCIIKNPLDFNKSKNYRFSYLSSEAERDVSGEEDEGDDNIDNSDIYSNNNEHEDHQSNSRINSMTQLQLSRKRNVSLVYENKQKIPSLIVQKKRKPMLLNGNFQSEPMNANVQPEESVLPPPVERSPQIRISSNIGETRKRIFSTSLGQSNDAVSRSEEVDPDKRKTIDMVFDDFDNNSVPRETPSKEATHSANGQNQPKINLYDATPNRFNSRIVSASNTVVKSQPIQNMIASVQRHTMSPQTKPVKATNGHSAASPTAHGKLDLKGAGEPILQSPGIGVLPPRADRIPMKQGLDVDMDPYPSSSSDSEDESKQSGEKGNHLETGGDLTPLNVKTASLLQVSEESPIRIGESNRSLVKLAKLPKKAERDQIEKSEDDAMDVEDVSVVLKTLEEAPLPVPVENGRTKRKAALAAAGRMDNKSVRVTDADGKEVLVPYNKVSSFMKNNNNNNLFDTLSSSNEPLKDTNLTTSKSIAEKILIALPTSEVPVEESKAQDPQNIKHNEKEENEEMDVEKMNASEESNGSESDSSSGSGSESDSEDEEEAKALLQKPRKVAADTTNTSQRVPSARQQQQKTDLKSAKQAQVVNNNAAEKTLQKLSTLQRMRLHKQTASLGSFSDLAARGIPPVHDKAAENRLMIEKKRKEEEQKKKQQQEKAAEKSQSDSEESSSEDSDSDSDSSDDSDSESGEKNDKSTPKFIKKAKKKSINAFASLVKDSKKI